MDFQEALQKSLKQDKHTHTDPFLLYSRLSDLIGDDYEAKKAAEQFYRLDASHKITQTTLQSALPPKRRKKKKHIYRVKPMPTPPDKAQVFYDTDTGTVHLLDGCPCIHDPAALRRLPYKKAKRLDVCRRFQNIGWWSPMLKRMARYHNPTICRRCGEFLVKNN